MCGWRCAGSEGHLHVVGESHFKLKYGEFSPPADFGARGRCCSDVLGRDTSGLTCSVKRTLSPSHLTFNENDHFNP